MCIRQTTNTNKSCQSKYAATEEEVVVGDEGERTWADEFSLVAVVCLCEPPRLDGVVNPFAALSPSPLPPLCIPEKY